jgi:hypothetical protein
MFNRIAPIPHPNRTRSWLTKLPVTVVLLVVFQVSNALAQTDSHSFKDVLEFRGFIRIAGQMEFSIFNKKSQQSEWLRLNQEIGGYRVESFDPQTNSVRLRYQGEVGSLFLQSSQIARYIPPLPAERPASPPSPRLAANSPSRPASSARAGEAQPNASRSSPPRPAEIDNSGPRGGSSQDWSQFLVGSAPGGFAPPPTTPAPPFSRPPGESPGFGPGGNQPDDGDEWQSTGSPPPLPPSPPPDYSPEG